MIIYTNKELKEKLKSMTNGIKIGRHIMNKYKIDDFIENNVIISLLKFHPTKPIDIDNLQYLIMKIDKRYKTRTIFYKNKNSNKVEDISWKKCIRNLFGKYNNENEHRYNIIKAFRNETHKGSKKKFYLNNTYIKNGIYIGKCEHCGKTSNKMSTDHYNLSFQEILDMFLKDNNIQLCNITIYKNKKGKFKIKDRKLANEWLLYHDRYATYRLLCRSCNAHFGSYGYRNSV
tara:strand:+ start:461 stop:1153 length:693 start_codon:yes stop_codon:yes gene_type:complete